MPINVLPYFLGAFLWVLLCGRFSITVSPTALKKRFKAELDKPLQPRYNAAPGQKLPVILNRSPNKILLCRWGFIPHWAKDASMDYRLINARAETIMENRIYRSAFRKRRCLVLADGFYEWQKTPMRKIPHRIVLQDGSPFAFAGIWSGQKNKNKHWINSFSIITTKANSLVAEIHDRMPVILQPQDETNWLNMPPEEAVNLLQPYSANLMQAYPVSSRVNSTTNDDPELIKPITLKKKHVKRLDDYF
ncbi:MAG: SOS response-associated peptidase [Candidatus Heimdallarchaeota archaeon]